MMKNLLTLVLASSLINAMAQAVVDPPVKVIQCGKVEVTGIVMSPKGEHVLVLHDKGAELRDLETGKLVKEFAYNEDGSNTVYRAIFNENGEYVVLIGLAGTREVWDVKTGKQDKMLALYKWIPDAIRTREMGLKKSNSAFDRFYQQTRAEHGALVAHAEKNGSVVFTDADGNVVQTLDFPTNKDKQHLAPCVFIGDRFVTGTDDGRVLFYDLVKP
ncbi:MAG: WD40 repeat domain-containing protein [Flavobacteriales bacterium]|nr:WD40 repeat domain-containing protein [Flavobacteriales bacterium]